MLGKHFATEVVTVTVLLAVLSPYHNFLLKPCFITYLSPRVTGKHLLRDVLCRKTRTTWVLGDKKAENKLNMDSPACAQWKTHLKNTNLIFMPSFLQMSRKLMGRGPNIIKENNIKKDGWYYIPSNRHKKTIKWYL